MGDSELLAMRAQPNRGRAWLVPIPLDGTPTPDQKTGLHPCVEIEMVVCLGPGFPDRCVGKSRHNDLRSNTGHHVWFSHCPAPSTRTPRASETANGPL